MSVKFTVALIARNEAPNMERLHRSLTEFQARGGEVVLVDTGSTDNTVEIARGYGFKVFEAGEKFIITVPLAKAKLINKKFIVKGEDPVVHGGDKIFDYASARNYAASVASNDVVSMPDCDEQYTKLNIDAIEKAIDEGYEQMEFHFIFAHYPDGTPSVQFRQCKMYDRRKLHWQGYIHEMLVGEAKRTWFPPDVLLLDHFPAPQEHRNRYMAGLALDCYNNPDNDRNSHYFGRELFWNNRPKSAIKELTRHVAMNRWAQERGESLIFIGDCYQMLGEEEKAVDSYQKAFVVDGTRRAPLLKLAEYFERKKDWQKVVCFAKAALEIPENDCYCNIGAHYTYEPHERLYVAYFWLGDKIQSRAHWEKAYQFFPNNPKFISDIQFYETLEYTDKGIEGWMTLRELNWLHKTAKTVNSILEIGSWKGRSTHALLSACPGKVTSVDTFQGSIDPRDDTNRQAKLIDVYSEFQKNVGSFNNLEVLRMTSKEAAAKCRQEGRTFDMIFIDAGHTYEEVQEDIALWKDMANIIISGHDYLPYTWMGVCKAVDEVYPQRELCESIWYTNNMPPIPKPMGRKPKSIQDMTRKIKEGIPLTYVKRGDGEQLCMDNTIGENCDHHPYSPLLCKELRKAFTFFNSNENVNIGWWHDELGPNDGRLILHRFDTDVKALKEFYMAIRATNKVKIFIGPARLQKAAVMLGCRFIEVPLVNAFAKDAEIFDKIKQYCSDGTIFVFCAGMGSKVWISRLLQMNPTISCIDAGSSLDPIFVEGGSRTCQISKADAEALYADVLQASIPKRIFTVWLNDKPEIPENIAKCIASQMLSGYEHEVITLDKCPKGIKYLDDAIAAKKWVKAADFIKLYELVERGGIYLDADVQILPGKNFDDLLGYEAFASYEKTNRFVANCVIGAQPQQLFLSNVLANVVLKFRGDDDKNFESSIGLMTEPFYRATDSGRVVVLTPDYFVPYDHQTGLINVTGNTRTFHHYLKSWGPRNEPDMLPQIGILIPTLGRPKGLQRCLDSIDKLYYPKHLIRVNILDGEGTVPSKVNKMYREMVFPNGPTDFRPEAFVYAANDMEFDPYCLYHAVMESTIHGLVAFNDGEVLPDKGNICTHFLIKKSLIAQIGNEIFSPKFVHVGCDNLLWAKADKLGQACRCEAAKINHHHFSKDGAWDSIYDKGWSNVEGDRLTLQRELEVLNGTSR